MRSMCLLATLCVLANAAGAGVVYHNTSGFAFSNFIPFGPDGTPARPVPGDHLGNQVTLAGTDRFLTDIQLFFGLNTNTGQNPNPATDLYTATLYRNDGSGGAPGSIIATSSLTGTNPGASVLFLTFPFATLVPDTFTVVVSSTHLTNTAATLTGIAGPYNAGGAPTVGSALNTVWYNTNALGTTWVSNPTWAISDGAATNYFSMTLDAVPEPGCIGLVTTMMAVALGRRQSRRSLPR